MTGGAAFVWTIVFGAAIVAALGLWKNPSSRTVNMVIIGGGIAFPTIGLACLLVFGLTLLPDWRHDPDRLQIRVRGEQWWWRVEYRMPGQPPVVSANEIHLPAGEPVEVVLTSADVIHSFWIPAIGGKMDMIPGRTTRLLLEATRPGVYRGVCAEYCGTAHAQMAFAAMVHEPEAFAAWLDSEGQPHRQLSADGERGAALFRSAGCGSCHRVSGLSERGSVGPDLTHIGSRRTIAAGILPNDIETLEDWIARPGRMKPGAQMPSFAMLPQEEITTIAQFLSELK